MARACHRLSLLMGALGMAGMLSVCAQQRSQPASAARPAPQPVAVSVEDLERSPEKFRERPVRVSGRLENEGRNYFTDLRVVLKDEEGRKVPVRPWLPVSLPPRPPSAATGSPRAVLSDFLGQEVELTATVRKGALRHFGDVWHLEVTSARGK